MENFGKEREDTWRTHPEMNEDMVTKGGRPSIGRRNGIIRLSEELPGLYSIPVKEM